MSSGFIRVSLTLTCVFITDSNCWWISKTTKWVENVFSNSSSRLYNEDVCTVSSLCCCCVIVLLLIRLSCLNLNVRCTNEALVRQQQPKKRQERISPSEISLENHLARVTLISDAKGKFGCRSGFFSLVPSKIQFEKKNSWIIFFFLKNRVKRRRGQLQCWWFLIWFVVDCSVCEGPSHKKGLYIQSTDEDSVARNAGIKAGDRILYCNGNDVTFMDFDLVRIVS